MRRLLACIVMLAPLVFGGTAHAQCTPVACADGRTCTDIVNVCHDATSCVGAVNFCPRATECSGAVNWCDLHTVGSTT